MRMRKSLSRAMAFIMSLAFVSASIALPAMPSQAISAAASVGSWNYTANNLQVSRYSFRATTLASGNVLIEGGAAPGAFTDESEIFTPSTNTWTPTGSLKQGRSEHSATILPGGKVLVAGGYAGPVLSSAELYDPASGMWTLTGSMSQARTRHSATLLTNGKVLVAGGWIGNMLSNAELYDPASGHWSSAGDMPTTRADHLAILLPNGKVLVMGGSPVNGGHTAETDLYDPATNQWSMKASMHVARSGLAGVLLNDGKVLVAGGTTDSGITATSELYDPASNQWSMTGGMQVARFSALSDGATLLNDGTVLIAGGGGDTQGTSEIYQPMSGMWGSFATMKQPQCDHATAKLGDGRVLIAAGYECDGTTLSPAVAQIYKPAVVISGVSPPVGPIGGGTVVTVAGSGFASGATLTIGGNAASNVNVSGTGTSITATTAAHAAGAVNLVVTNSDGQSATLPNAFTFYDPTVPGNVLLPIPARPALSCLAGGVRVYAASFTGGCGANWSATGSLWIGDYTIVENASLTLNGGALSGSGLVSMMTTSNGSQRTVLFQDSFAVNTTSGILTPQSAPGYQFKLNNLAGFRVNPTSYQLRIDAKGGTLSGTVSLSLAIPNNLASPRNVTFSLDHNGKLDGTLVDATTFSLGMVTLIIGQGVLQDSNLLLTQAWLQLPVGLGGTKVALGVDDARITGDGHLVLTKSAGVVFPNISVGGAKGFGIEGAKATIAIENGAYVFHGEGNFLLPGLPGSKENCAVGVGFSLASSPPPVREASLSLSGCFKIPIGTTGFFLTSVDGTVTLDETTTYVEMNVGVQGGPNLPDGTAAISGTLGGHWDSSWAVGLQGSLKFFNWPGADATLTLSQKNGFIGSLHMTVLNVFDGTGQVHVWSDNSHFHFTGQGTVSVQVPKSLIHQCILDTQICVSWPSVPIPGPSASAQFGEFRTPTSTSDYGLKGQITVSTILGSFRPTFFVDTSKNINWDLGGLQQYQLADQTTSARRTRTTMSTQSMMTATYPITVGTTPTLIVIIAYDAGTPTLTLTDPNGQTITPATSDPDIFYTTDGQQLVYTVAARLCQVIGPRPSGT